jgi:multicomponent Na+:H+ antiporter subunit D
LLASTLLNAAYFVPVIYRAFFRPAAPGVDHSHFKEAPLVMVVPLCLTAAISVTLGFFPQIFTSLVNAFGRF